MGEGYLGLSDWCYALHCAAEETELCDMTEEQFWEYWDGLEEQVLEFELIPFSALAVTGC